MDGSIKCIEDEIPFELPEGWAWTRLGSIGNWQSGATPSRHHSEYYGGSIPWLKTGDLNDGFINSVSEYITEEGFNNSSVVLNPVGSVLIAMYGATIGKLGITNIEVTTNQACCACLPIIIVNQYLFYFLMYQKKYFIEKAVGGAQPNISKEKIVATLFPVPPLREQKELVSMINNLISKIDSIASCKNEIENKIGITKTRILDLAIRGLLVPQDPNDEPASILLDRIHAEKEELIKQGKLKRDKKESVIFKGEDNSYYATIEGTRVAISEYLGYELPLGWTWITLGDIALVTSGKTPKSIQLSISGEVPYFKVADMNVQGNELYMQHSDNYVNESYSGPIFEKGSFIFPKNGGAVLTNKKRILLQPSVVDLNTGVFTPSHLIDSKFAFYLFTSIDFSKIYKGAVIPTVDSSVIRNLIYAMPPLEEQKRIASAITTIFAKIEKIEDALF